MPTRAVYPPSWKEVSVYVRRHRAGGRCECVGECGLHNRTRGPRRCEEMNGYRAKWAKGRVVLTTAHLCECDPLCALPAHLKAMCNRCHLRLDSKLHQRNAATTRMKKRENAGQGRLLP